MESRLQEILIHTYHADPQLRAQAEAALKQFVFSENALFAILSFVGNQSIHRDLRQAAAIQLKNRITELWREAIDDPTDPTQKIHLSLADKENARVAFLTVLLVETDNSIRGLLAEAVKSIADIDYPLKWPSLLPTLLANVQQPDVLKMYNSLLAIRKVAKRYEYKPKETRGPLNDLVQASFPLLQQLMIQILHNHMIESAQVQRMCLKIFWSATMYVLPQVQGVDVNGWFQIIGHVIHKVRHHYHFHVNLPRSAPLSFSRHLIDRLLAISPILSSTFDPTLIISHYCPHSRTPPPLFSPSPTHPHTGPSRSFREP